MARLRRFWNCAVSYIRDIMGMNQYYTLLIEEGRWAALSASITTANEHSLLVQTHLPFGKVFGSFERTVPKLPKVRLFQPCQSTLQHTGRIPLPFCARPCARFHPALHELHPPFWHLGPAPLLALQDLTCFWYICFVVTAIKCNCVVLCHAMKSDERMWLRSLHVRMSLAAVFLVERQTAHCLHAARACVQAAIVVTPHARARASVWHVYTVYRLRGFRVVVHYSNCS